MNVRSLVLASFAAGLLATAAVAAEPAPAPAPTAQPAAPAPADQPGGWDHRGQQENKQRINIVARKPHRHDIAWIDQRDRATWREFTTWQGVRDERPMVARKTMGFHEPDPRATRAERVERVSRGPIRGPAPSE